jgi:plastocyanin
MKTTRTLAVLAGLLAVAQAGTAGTITGTVTLKGTPPKEQENTQIMSDATCSKLHAKTPTTEHYIVGGKGELANVVVMLKGVPSKPAGAGAAPVVLDQKGCVYTPSILAVQVGQKVEVKNSDPVAHNVHTLPAGTSNKEVNNFQAQGAAPLDFAFTAPENFLKFKCDVHPWMFAWVTVVDHPYFAVTDKEGKFTIKDVPAGKYKLVAMHRKAAPAPTGVEQDVEVKDGEVKSDFTLEVK